MKKIEKLKPHFEVTRLSLNPKGKDLYELKSPTQEEIVAKINEIIDCINMEKIILDNQSDT